MVRAAETSLRCTVLDSKYRPAVLLHNNLSRALLMGTMRIFRPGGNNILWGDSQQLAVIGDIGTKL